MSLSQSLFSAISGLINHQTRMDNIGNNLANINTVGYKRSVMQFADVFSQTLRSGSGPNGTIGGTNPMQIGLGMQVASVTQDFNQGAMNSTGKASDLAIEGDGFFKLVNAGNTRYSRDGSLTLGQGGELQNAFGYYLQGWMADSLGVIDTSRVTENLVIPLGELRVAKATSKIDYVGNLNASGLVAAANTATVDNNNVLRSVELIDLSTGLAATAASHVSDLSSNGTTALFTTPGAGLTSTITIGAVKGNRTISEDITFSSATTLTTLMTDIKNALGTQAGDAQAGVSLKVGEGATGGNVVRVAGNAGTLNDLSGLTLTEGNDVRSLFTQTAAANGESTVTTLGVYDSLGDSHMVTMTMSLVDQTSTGSTWRWYADCADDSTPALGVGTGTVTFDANGQFSSETNNTISIDLSAQGVTTPLVIDPNLNLLTQFASATGSALEGSSQDGSPMGTLTSYAIGEDGLISGLFSNGLRQDLGRVNITRFANNNGLVRDNQNLFTISANSGLPQDGEPQDSARGLIRSGALEGSNVDIAQEFTDMIMTQRGYQANARTITTSDQMLQDLMNLGR